MVLELYEMKNYTLARDSRELQHRGTYSIRMVYYTLARDSRELQRHL